MTISELIDNRAKQLKSEVGLALSLSECESFVASCVNSVISIQMTDALSEKCQMFLSDSNTSSVTKCKFCGKEKFEHSL